MTPAPVPTATPSLARRTRSTSRALVALKDVPPGTAATLRRLTEDLELELDVMRFLEDSGLMPGGELR